MLLSRDEPDNSEKKTWQKLFIKTPSQSAEKFAYLEKYCTYDVGIILNNRLHILLQPEIFWAAAHVTFEECAEMALILETETV